MKQIIIEVIASSLADCQMAIQAGANRVELCQAVYPQGGLTPSLGTLVQAKSQITKSTKIACMVRPRAAGFLYSDDEFKVMLQDVKLFCKNGADAIVFGFLKEDFSLDINKTQQLVNLVKGYSPFKECVFHRAFDLTKEVDNSVISLINIGVDRVLTSGHAEDAIKGVQEIKYLQTTYGDKIQILPGGGLRSNNVKDFIIQTRVKQVHAGSHLWKTDITTSNAKVNYSYLTKQNNNYNYLDLDNVKNFVSAVHSNFGSAKM
ncbi:MAG: hypothetical protein LBT99_02185 [Bifidobacteriaceae bacterium]|jgi:copper homeostasis protein|nr:hypothetical protein [Bifidobacteriaceae bacterium]